MSFGHRGSTALMDGPFSAENVNVTDRLAKHLFIKEQNRIQSLILGAG